MSNSRIAWIGQPMEIAATQGEGSFDAGTRWPPNGRWFRGPIYASQFPIAWFACA